VAHKGPYADAPPVRGQSKSWNPPGNRCSEYISHPCFYPSYGSLRAPTKAASEFQR